MSAILAAPESVASWVVAGLLGDGIDIWVNADDVIVQHGPEAARAHWWPTVKALHAVLRCYLREEIYPARGR